MKKLICFIIAAVFCMRVPTASFAENELTGIDASNASAALLINADTGRVLYRKDADALIDPAGLKRLPALLTVCLAFDEELILPDTDVIVSSEAAAIRGVTAFISPNEHIKADLLLKASVILMAGDALYALLQSLCGTESAALEAVNNRMKALGVPDLSSPLGEGGLFCLNDLAKICLRLTQSRSYLKYSSVYLDSITHENGSATELTNPNRLVRHYSGCYGVGTGSIGASEYSCAAAAKRGSTSFIAIAAGLPDSASRFKLVTDMLDAGFASYRTARIGSAGEEYGIVAVNGGLAASVSAVLANDVFALVPVADPKYTSEAQLPDSVEAPLFEGDEIGLLIIRDRSGYELSRAPLTASETIEKAGFLTSFLSIVRSWLGFDRETGIAMEAEITADRSD